MSMCTPAADMNKHACWLFSKTDICNSNMHQNNLIIKTNYFDLKIMMRMLGTIEEECKLLSHCLDSGLLSSPVAEAV